MAVADQNVGPAVIVEIEKPAAPAQELRVCAQARRECCVFKSGLAKIVIERRGVSREVGFHQVEVSVQIVIGGRNPHPRLRLAIGAQRTTRFQRDVHKFSVLLILIKGTRG